MMDKKQLRIKKIEKHIMKRVDSKHMILRSTVWGYLSKTVRYTDVNSAIYNLKHHGEIHEHGKFLIKAKKPFINPCVFHIYFHLDEERSDFDEYMRSRNFEFYEYQILEFKQTELNAKVKK